jgi:hypothetical protein
MAILERLVSVSFDDEQNIKAIKFLGEADDEFGRKALIAINAESRLFPLLEQLYQEFSDGYEVIHADYSVTSVKIKWEEQNPIKVDLGIKAKSTKFGTYAQTLPSPSTVHVTELNSLIRSISEAAFKEFVSYDKAVPAYTEPVYEQKSLFAVPDLVVAANEAA